MTVGRLPCGELACAAGGILAIVVAQYGMADVGVLDRARQHDIACNLFIHAVPVIEMTMLMNALCTSFTGVGGGVAHRARHIGK
ncbi:hypothetical protein GCM10009094_41760 [Massilia aurea]